MYRYTKISLIHKNTGVTSVEEEIQKRTRNVLQSISTISNTKKQTQKNIADKSSRIPNEM